MKLLATILAFGGLLGGGLAAALAAADNGPPVPAPASAVASKASLGESFVTGLGFSCDSEHWRVGFTLARSARVDGRLDRRLARTPAHWALAQRFEPRLVKAGPRVLDLGTHRSGTYRVRLTFRASDGETAVRSMVFRAGCTNPPPPPTTPTLPGGTEPRA